MATLPVMYIWIGLTCLKSSYSALYVNPPHLNVSGEYPAHTVASLARTNMCVDRVAVLHSPQMTCRIMYVSGIDVHCIVSTEWMDSSDDSL